MQTQDDESSPEKLPNRTLSWAYDDGDEPAEITIFDPENEITTRWITMDKSHVWNLDESR